MEEVVFPKTKKEMQEFVELRLHTDHNDLKLKERWVELQKKLVGKLALPSYVIVDPKEPTKPLAQNEALQPAATWAKWLQKHAKPLK